MRTLIIACCLTITGCGQELVGPAGPQGEPGQQGTQGIQGETGTEGPMGSIGPTGDTDPSGIVIIPLCPGIPGAYPELLFRLAGKLYGVYYDGNGAREVELGMGSYHTTDGRNCNFQVDAQLNVHQA